MRVLIAVPIKWCSRPELPQSIRTTPDPRFAEGTRVRSLLTEHRANRDGVHALAFVRKIQWGRAKDHAMAAYPLPVRRSRPTNDELHPLVYRAMIGLTVWLVLSVWALFSRGAYEGLTLSVITLFFLVLVGIPVILW